jgi:hypothetical protein
MESSNDLDGTPVDPHVRAAMLKVFRALNDLNPARQFGVERNGIALLLAYCIAAVQQEDPLLAPQPGQ